MAATGRSRWRTPVGRPGIEVESDEHSLTIGPDGPSVSRTPRVRVRSAASRSPMMSAHSPRPQCSARHDDRDGDPFSTVAGERGSPDTWRDPRGFVLKFYTTEGNYDIVGNDTPVFFLRDPLKFPSFIRSQKRRADNNLRDHDMQWDFRTLSPESAHQVTWLMGDRGIPRSWRYMNLSRELGTAGVRQCRTRCRVRHCTDLGATTVANRPPRNNNGHQHDQDYCRSTRPRQPAALALRMKPP